MCRWEDADLEELKIKIARDSTAVKEEENSIAIQKKINNPNEVVVSTNYPTGEQLTEERIIQGEEKEIDQ